MNRFIDNIMCLCLFLYSIHEKYYQLPLCIVHPVPPLFLPIEPCPPNNVEASVHCQNDIGTVSWEASIGAVGYEARLAGRDGHSLSCYTKETFCDVEDLHCGTVYYTNVITIGETHNSSASNTVLLISGMAPSAIASVYL